MLGKQSQRDIIGVHLRDALLIVRTLFVVVVATLLFAKVIDMNLISQKLVPELLHALGRKVAVHALVRESICETR